MSSAGFIHTLDPYALQFGGGFGLRWYGLSYLAGFLAGYLVFMWLARAGRTPLKAALVGDFVFAIALGTIVGGRLGFCIFYDPGLFLRLSSEFPFWGVFEVHRGGMASHGGIVGIIVACLWFAKKHGLRAGNLLDLAALAGGIGIFFGRIANFVNGELVGRPCSESLPWAVRFPQDILLWPIEEPQRLSTLGPMATKLGISDQVWQEATARAPDGPLVHQTLERIIALIQSGNQTLTQTLGPLLTPRHPSQIYEALLEGAFMFVAMLWLWRRPRKPGVITGWFLVLYPVVRILGEQFRMPDSGIGFQLFGLTRGQWLSFGMLVVGAVLLWFWSTRPGGHEAPLTSP